MEEISLNEVINEIKKIKEKYQNKNGEEKIAKLKNLNIEVTKGLQKIKDEEIKKMIENMLNFINVEYLITVNEFIEAKNETIDVCNAFIINFENIKSTINNALYQNFKIKLDFDSKE